MSPFILLFSILIIIVSICLIIFNPYTVLSNTDFDATIKQEKSSNDTEHREQDDFERIFFEKMEPVFNGNDLFADNSAVEMPSNNEKIINESKTEKNTTDFNDINDIDEMFMKINELKVIGLSNQEIAKKLGKGIREIDIILKIDNLRKISNS